MDLEANATKDSRRPWQDAPVPDAVTCTRSSLSDEERRYLTWLTTNKFEGWGAIVELGCLGGSSAALAEGLRRRGMTTRINSLDSFVWEDWMAMSAPSHLKPGEDRLPLFLGETAEYHLWIDAQKTDVFKTAWDGGAIEILVLYAAKTWDSANAALRVYGPHLVPGRSRVVVRDFRFYFAHCLPLIFDSRPDVWKQVEDVELGHTVAFMPLRPLRGISGIDEAYSEESFPLESADHLLRSRMAREDGQNRQSLLRSLYRKYLLDGSPEEARNLREEVLAAGIGESELETIEHVEYLLLPRGWKALELKDYATAQAVAERCLALPPGKRSIYSLTLLGYSLLRAGDREHAELAIDEALSLLPGYLVARIFRVELALRDGRYDEAAAEALDVLKSATADEAATASCLPLLIQAWEAQQVLESRLATLSELAESFTRSPSFLAFLAAQQLRAGQAREAKNNVARALELAPGHALATKIARRVKHASGLRSA